MAERRNQDSLRFRYGKCLNDNCEKCKSKEVITVPARKDFVCPECGSKLFECAPPKQKSKTPLYAGIAIVAAVLIGVGVWAFWPKSDNKEQVSAGGEVVVDPKPGADPEETITVPTPKPVQNPGPEPGQTAKGGDSKVSNPNPAPNPKPQPTTSEHKLDYGIWKGGWENGKPHGTHGTMKYTTSHLIDSRDPKKRMAEPGDYIIGEWSDGKLVQGIWYDSSNTVKGSIMIGQ